MKKFLTAMTTALLILSLAACGSTNAPSTPSEQSTPAPLPTEQSTAATAEVTEESPSVEDIVYEFELTDIDGKVHKLSDYQGKPVYLRVWASWCGVCMTSLANLDELAGEAKDYAVLSVVMPGDSGEMNAEDFIKWYKDLGYNNLTVLLDPETQIVSDFGINAYPSQIMFDAKGHIVYGVVGLMENDLINQTMQKIAAGER